MSCREALFAFAFIFLSSVSVVSLSRNMKQSKSGRSIENVWDYPRPPRLEKVEDEVVIVFNGKEIVRTTESYRVLETSHPPTFYIPRKDIDMNALQPSDSRKTFCEWKGSASYFDVVVDGKAQKAAAWTYIKPSKRFADIKDYISFYPGRMDECSVDGEVVEAQAGDFYGGWKTSWISGGQRGIKGAPGTEFW